MWERLNYDYDQRIRFNFRRPAVLFITLLTLFFVLIVILALAWSPKHFNRICFCENNGTCIFNNGVPVCNCSSDYTGVNCTYNKISICKKLATEKDDFRVAVKDSTCYILQSYSSIDRQLNWNESVHKCGPGGLLFRPDSNYIMEYLFNKFDLPRNAVEEARMWTGLKLINNVWYYVNGKGEADTRASYVPWENDGWTSNTNNKTEYAIADFHMDDEMKPGGSVETMINNEIKLSFICQFNLNNVSLIQSSLE